MYAAALKHVWLVLGEKGPEALGAFLMLIKSACSSVQTDQFSLFQF